ncbi:MAG: WG repeat-containing protein, partial [Clostridiales bacterium]|nr:WG repeat-containing protein [Clostridiales bacterium]
MAGKTNLSRIITCCFAVVCLVGIPAGGMSAAALAPEPVNGVGVDIQWLDFGSEYKNYWIQELSDTGYYLISMGADDEGNVSTTGVVNGKMEVVVEPDVFDVSGSSGDAYQMVVLRKGDTCYFISADGLGKAGVAKVDVSAYSELRYFHNGYANVTLKSNSMNGVIDSAGNLVFTNGDYKGFYHIGEGVFAATADADWGFETAGHLVDSSGRLLCATYYESISNVSEGMIRVSKNGKYGFVDLSGSDVVPMTYDKAYPYQDGVAAVQANGKWGLIGKTGDEVAAFAYDQINHLDDGLYCVAASDKYGVVNTAGETILPIEYDNVYSSYYINRGKGFAASKASETFLMDIAGEVVFSGEYSEMYFNSNGTVNVVKTVGGRQTQAVFDSTGNNLTGFKEFSLYYQN